MPGPEPPHQMNLALAILLDAYQCAQALGRSIWDFAVEIESLRRAGITNTDLRYLICAGYAKHVAEVTQPTSRKRMFRKLKNLSFTDKTCLILTGHGESFACRAGVSRVTVCEGVDKEGTNGKHTAPDTEPAPKWDRDRRELRLGDLVVKRFATQALCQEMICAAFEEESWPFRIDDPLPPIDGLEPKRRLHDTINKLNGHQIHPVIRFRGDGTGRGISWEPRWSPPTASNGHRAKFSLGPIRLRKDSRHVRSRNGLDAEAL